MTFDKLIRDVRSQTELGSNLEAIETVRATLETLSECLSIAAADELALALPPVLSDSLRREDWKTVGEAMDLSTFLRWVARREGTDDLTVARAHAEAVLRAILPVLSDDVRASLPEELSLLLPGGDPECAHMHQLIA